MSADNRARLESLIRDGWNVYTRSAEVPEVLGVGGDILSPAGTVAVIDGPLLRHDIHVMLHAFAKKSRPATPRKSRSSKKRSHP